MVGPRIAGFQVIVGVGSRIFPLPSSIFILEFVVFTSFHFRGAL
jgi:hypothetical protein